MGKPAYDTFSSSGSNSSLGVEVTANVLADADFLNSGVIKHAQISLPGIVDMREASKLSERFELIIHSNLLNTLGQNCWSELESFSRSINAVKALRVIEHLTLFSDASGAKSAVPQDITYDDKLLQRAIYNISRWQTMLDAPVAIENAPVTEQVEAYFNFYLELRRATGCELVCDVPHLFISAHAANWSQDKLRSMAAKINPLQIHLGGLSNSGGLIFDNHKILHKPLVAWSKAYFPGAQELTLEQDSMIPNTTLKRLLDDVENIVADPASVKIDGLAATARQTNNHLRRVSWAREALAIEDTRASAVATHAFKLLERYSPFVSPFATLDCNAESMEAKVLLRTASNLLKSSLVLSDWFDSRKMSAKIEFGNNQTELFHKMFGSHEWDSDNQMASLNFRNEKGEWVRISVCSFDLNQHSKSERSQI